MIVQLRALNEDMDKNLRVPPLDRDGIEVEGLDEGKLEIEKNRKSKFFLQVKVLLDQYDTNGLSEINLEQFKVTVAPFLSHIPVFHLSHVTCHHSQAT